MTPDAVQVAWAGDAAPSPSNVTKVATTAPQADDLARDLEVSGTAIQLPIELFQTDLKTVFTEYSLKVNKCNYRASDESILQEFKRTNSNTRHDTHVNLRDYSC